MQVKITFNLLFVLSLFLGSIINDAFAQTWRSLNGPLESDVRDIIIKNDTIYVASWDPGGIFKKGLGSNQWLYSEIAEGEGAFRKGIEGLLSISVDDDGNYHAGGNGIYDIGSGQGYNHFFSSNDYGRTWKELREGIESCGRVSDIFITNDKSTLIGCGEGIYKLVEEENRFEQVGDGWVSRSSIFFQQHDTLIAGSEEGVEISMDNGNTWTKVGPDTLEIYSITFAEENFYLGTNLGLYRTEDFEQSWKKVNGLPFLQVNTLFHFQDIIIAGTDSGIYSITPSDLEAQIVFPELEEQRVNVINGREESLYIGTETGFYSCKLSQNTCNLQGVPSTEIKTIDFWNEDTLLTGSINKIHRYFSTTDQWDSLTISVDRTRSIVPINNDSLLAINGSFLYGCSFGNADCDSVKVDSDNSLFDLKQNSAGDLFVASRERVFTSTDKGENWEVIYTSPERKNFNLVPYSDSLLFINGDGIKYNLTDNTQDTISKTAHIITKDGTIYSSSDGVHKSTDFGETWTTILRSSDITNEGLGGLKSILYDGKEEKLYAITTEGSVFVSKNEREWGVNKEMHPVYMETAAIGPNGTLYLGTQRAGVFTNTEPLNPPITISNEKEPGTTVPKQFSLQQNYPNPFNPSTTVPFELSQASEVRISLYNVFGQKVREYTLGRKTAGTHHHQINMDQQASGVYFLEVQAGEHSEVIKMSFIK